MKYIYIILMLLGFVFQFQVQAQNKPPKSLIKTAAQRAKELAKKAPITSYKIISLQRDTTLVDTTLSIKKEYDYNYLRKDLFGLMPFPNEGQTYNTLHFGRNALSAFPEFGFKAKHFAYLEQREIQYYSVPTPLTELYFKTVMEQGQNVDAFITLNTSKNFNFSIAFKGLRSLGKYINQLSSSGNFRFTSNYTTTDKRYSIRFHYTGQDILNGENGGLTTPSDFESNDPTYKNRPRLQVYLTDAKSFLKGKRFFFDHDFRINPKETNNNIILTHQFSFEHQYFEYNQATLGSKIGTFGNSFQRFGASSVASNINDQTFYDKLYNKFGALYENKHLGRFQFFTENFNYNYSYDFDKNLSDVQGGVASTLYLPKALKASFTTVGGQYEYRKKNWHAIVTASNSISTISMRDFEAQLNYNLGKKISLVVQYQNISKIPNHNFNLHQSSYNRYNWNNDFNNEKSNALSGSILSPFGKAEVQMMTLKDHLYFSNDTIGDYQQYITPKQYAGTINYLSLKYSKELKYKKWALDNTLLYQKVVQNEAILNVPQFVLRHTLYYSKQVFQKAMFLQTGVSCNYFTSYYAEDYNPVLGEFFVQNTKKIGSFPMLDFFVNACVKQTRIYLKAEHFNSSFTGNKFYAAPSIPYHDFMIRFGLVWNFFQ